MLISSFCSVRFYEIINYNDERQAYLLVHMELVLFDEFCVGPYKNSLDSTFHKNDSYAALLIHLLVPLALSLSVAAVAWLWIHQAVSECFGRLCQFVGKQYNFFMAADVLYESMPRVFQFRRTVPPLFLYCIVGQYPSSSSIIFGCGCSNLSIDPEINF